jgi:DUF4097 and DUF4098 domain-containing protein YvlB
MRKTLCAIGLLIGSVACSDCLTDAWVDGCVDCAALEGEWRGQIEPGKRIQVNGITGDIQASLATGNEVVVSWIKHGKHSDPSGVRIAVVTHDDGVTICAVYPDVPGKPHNECLPDGAGNNSVDNNDVEVDFQVSVPAGVTFHGKMVTGDIVAESLESDAFVSTVTGDVSVSTAGLAIAATVTGSVFASISQTDWDRDLTFCTVTGSVTVEIPAGTNADVYASTVTGSVHSDFPLSQNWGGVWRGTLGSGGRKLTAATVTGSVWLKSAG